MVSQKFGSAQPTHGWPHPMGQLVPSFHRTTGQFCEVAGPLQPIL